MRKLLLVLLFLLTASPLSAQQPAVSQTMRFKALALACLHREYPNKIGHVLTSDADVAPPRELTPIFYGCFDWHSAVHGHWLLVRLLRLYPAEDDKEQVEALLDVSFQPDAVTAEIAYMAREERADFERPYGAAWLLQLMAELREWDDPRALRWRRTLAPLEAAYVARISDWLSKLAYPIRIGEHCTVGQYANIFPGVTMGDNCHVGAMSLVPKGMKLDANAVYGGVPVRKIRDLSPGKAPPSDETSATTGVPADGES